MKKFYLFLMISFGALSLNQMNAQDLLISGVFDGQPSWAGGSLFPKGVELYATANIPDLSIYGVSSANNGNGATGSPEFTFPAVSVTAGQFIYVVSDSAGFYDFFGFAADYANSAANINGDDAIELFQNGNVIDVFGDVDVDGTGQPWEYLDGWGYRVDATGPDGSTFVLGNWTFSAIDDLQGATDNASSPSPFPIGTYQITAPADTTVSFQAISGLTTEGAGTFTLNIRLDQSTSSAVSVDVDLLSGTAANLGNTFPETVNFAAGTTTATLDITLNDDAAIEADETYEFILENGGVLVLGSDSIFTLVVEDDDTPIPAYSIATVTTIDALGESDSSGVECILYGVVNSPERGFSSTEFSMQDATGGITVYQGGTAITYEAAVGDSVEVIGEIDQRFGVTVITNISALNLLSSGASVTEAVATMPMESNESSLIRVNGLQMVDPSDWNATGGSGFDVPVYTLANDTFVMRIDRDYDALYNSTDVPCGVFDVIGVAGQYDVDTPLFDDYQLLPRFLSDIIDTCTISPPALTIGDATEVDANGDPVLFGTDVTLRGIITSPDFRELQNEGTEFSFADATGGIWAFSSDSAIVFDPTVGDSVEVSGEIYASNGVTRIRISSVTTLGAATPWTPTVVTTALDESHEAELITIEGLTLQGTWETSGGSYNVSASNSNGTYDIRVDADRAELFAPILSGGETFNLTGIGSQYDPTAPRTEGYAIHPRFASDIDITNAISEIDLANFSVSPVPANEVLNISFDYDANEAVTIRLINVIGQVSLETAVSLVDGNNKVSMDVANTTPGFYMLQIATEKGVSNTSVLIK